MNPTAGISSNGFLHWKQQTVFLIWVCAAGVSAFSAPNHRFKLKAISETPIVKSCVETRRDLLRDTAATSLSLFGLSLFPAASYAADPITTQELENVGTLFQRAGRPKPPKVLRRKLNLDFAVLLMRSSYKVLDDLDCVAMDQFQRDFFIIRQSEYEPYLKLVGPGLVQQGDLTDPYYFDFISLTQYEAINRDITVSPPMVFSEQQPVDQGEDQPQRFDAVVVRRDPKITNAMLAPEHSRRVGTMILDRLIEIFGNSDSAIPEIAPNSRPEPEVLLASIKQMVNLFLVNGFAFGGRASVVSNAKGGTQICIELDAPATLWSSRVLQYQGAVLNNNFVLKTAEELIRRSGYQIKATSLKYDGKLEQIFITIV